MRQQLWDALPGETVEVSSTPVALITLLAGAAFHKGCTRVVIQNKSRSAYAYWTTAPSAPADTGEMFEIPPTKIHAIDLSAETLDTIFVAGDGTQDIHVLQKIPKS